MANNGLLIGVIVVVIIVIAAFLLTRGPSTTTASTTVATTISGGGGGATTSIISNAVPSTTIATQPSTVTFNINESENPYGFSPLNLSVKNGTTVTFNVYSLLANGYPHSFAMQAPNSTVLWEHTLLPGQNVTVTYTFKTVGSYEIYSGTINGGKGDRNRGLGMNFTVTK